MTTPKIKTVNRNGSRLYVIDDDEHPGVTSVVGMLPKEFLKFWAAKVVAEEAVASDVDKLVELKGPDGAINWLKKAPDRNVNKAADTGTEVHGIVEDLINGESVSIKEEHEPFVSGFDQFVSKFRPKWLLTEETVYGSTPSGGYAGSFDAIASINEETWIIDFKTTRSGVHTEVAIQLAAYANADRVVNPDGTSGELPEIQRAGVVWLRPDAWSFVPIRGDLSKQGPYFQTFTALRQVWEWQNVTHRKALDAVMAAGVPTARPF